MIAGINSAISALSAFEKKLNSTAHNIANVNTDGYKRTRVIIEDNGSQGVSADVQKVNTPGPRVYEPGNGTTSLVEKSNVDLSTEMVNLIVARRSYQANIKTFQTSDEILGSLMDIIG